MLLAYCMAFRERMNSGLPLGSQPSNWVMVVSVIMIPAVFMMDIEDHDPALAGEVAGPVVVGDHDLVIFGHAAGGDEGAAISGSCELGVFCRLVLLVQPGKVIVHDFFEGVERHDVI